MDDATRYRLNNWRKRLERRGWTGLRRSRPPGNRLVEYHVIWQGRLISGRVRLGELDHYAGFWEPGSPVYLLERGQDVVEGCGGWRRIRLPSLARWCDPCRYYDAVSRL